MTRPIEGTSGKRRKKKQRSTTTDNQAVWYQASDPAPTASSSTSPCAFTTPPPPSGQSARTTANFSLSNLFTVQHTKHNFVLLCVLASLASSTTQVMAAPAAVASNPLSSVTQAYAVKTTTVAKATATPAGSVVHRASVKKREVLKVLDPPKSKRLPDRYTLNSDGDWEEAEWELYGVRALITSVAETTAAPTTTTSSPIIATTTTSQSSSSATVTSLPPGWGDKEPPTFNSPIIIACTVALFFIVFSTIVTFVVRRARRRRMEARAERARQRKLKKAMALQHEGRPASIASSNMSDDTVARVKKGMSIMVTSYSTKKGLSAGLSSLRKRGKLALKLKGAKKEAAATRTSSENDREATMPAEPPVRISLERTTSSAPSPSIPTIPEDTSRVEESSSSASASATTTSTPTSASIIPPQRHSPPPQINIVAPPASAEQFVPPPYESQQSASSSSAPQQQQLQQDERMPLSPSEKVPFNLLGGASMFTPSAGSSSSTHAPITSGHIAIDDKQSLECLASQVSRPPPSSSRRATGRSSVREGLDAEDGDEEAEASAPPIWEDDHPQPSYSAHPPQPSTLPAPPRIWGEKSLHDPYHPESVQREEDVERGPSVPPVFGRINEGEEEPSAPPMDDDDDDEDDGVRCSHIDLPRYT